MTEKKELITALLSDIMGQQIDAYDLREVPSWLYDMAAEIIDSGWRKESK